MLVYEAIEKERVQEIRVCVCESAEMYGGGEREREREYASVCL